MRTVTAADANRQFSSLLRDVSQGEIFTVVSRGKPVATIAPAKLADAQRNAAKAALVARLRKQEVEGDAGGDAGGNAGGERNWTRDELYER
jgi:prevent-host-death family protein